LVGNVNGTVRASAFEVRFQQLRPSQTLHISDIKMFDANRGWATDFSPENVPQNNLEYHILHTGDGGRTWQDVTPQGVSEIGTYLFRDASHAWGVSGWTIWQTGDAGQSWSSKPSSNLFGNSFPSFPSFTLTLADEQQGWVLTRDCCAAGNEGAYLYMTTNSGTSWKLINYHDSGGDYDSTKKANHDLESFYHTGIKFFDTRTGLMTLAGIGNFGEILRTTDEGFSWHPLPLPLAAGMAYLNPQYDPNYKANIPCGFIDPMIFSAKSATVWNYCGFLYHTDDAGQTWRVTPQVPVPETSLSLIIEPPLNMVSAEIGWIILLNSEDQWVLFQTVNGGETWTQVIGIPDTWKAENDVGLDFLNKTVGWARTGAGDLLETQDGGKSWEQLNPRIADKS